MSSSHAMTYREFWNRAFLAASHRLDPSEAAQQADQAAKIADGRWRKAVKEPRSAYAYDDPIGTAAYVPPTDIAD